ncbi:MAG: hypothetical protein ACXADB_07025 [Candidatus Hermodarchaeia archaeon]|jgi:hypothetical protein
MEISPLNKNEVKKSFKASPMPSSMERTHHITYPLPKRSWIIDNRLPLYYLISVIAGLLLLYIAIFIPPAFFIEEISTGTGSRISLGIISIVSSPIPFIISIGIGLTAAGLIPLADHNSFRHRLSGAVLFAVLFAIAYFIDMVNINLLYSIIGPMYGLTPFYDMLLWLTSPWLFMLIAYFGEFLWTSLRGPMHIDPKTRRTAVIIRGGPRGTVLSVNHKGGYTRGFTRPSKWQGYDRED